jgi:hypothetical protein
LVYASATTKLFGAPMPMVVFELRGGHWLDFVGPTMWIAPFYNFAVWLGVHVAPVTLPRWWRRSGRATFARMIAAPFSKKLTSVFALGLAVAMPPLVGHLVTVRHVLVVRNRSGITIRQLSIRAGRTFRPRGPVPPGEERVFDFEGAVEECATRTFAGSCTPREAGGAS